MLSTLDRPANPTVIPSSLRAWITPTVASRHRRDFVVMTGVIDDDEEFAAWLDYYDKPQRTHRPTAA